MGGEARTPSGGSRVFDHDHSLLVASSEEDNDRRLARLRREYLDLFICIPPPAVWGADDGVSDGEDGDSDGAYAGYSDSLVSDEEL